MNTRNQIISRSPTSGRAAVSSTQSPSTQHTDNPFNSVFDGDDSDDSWNDEENISSPLSPKTRLAPRITQWPKHSANIITNRIGNSHRTPSGKHERRQSVHKLTREKSTIQRLTREKSKGRQRKIVARLGIKVETNFSTHHGPKPQPIQSRPTPPGAFVNMAALEALENVAVQPHGTFWKSLKNKKLRANGSSPEKNDAHQPMNNPTSTTTPLAERRRSLRPTPLKLGDDLSPNDRPIVIGISIPSARLAQHTTSPQTGTSIASSMLDTPTARNTPTGRDLVTPSITVTPAHEISAWSPYSTASNVSRARTLSTSYSISSPNDPFQHGAPPLPTMPADLVEKEKIRIAAEQSYFSPDSDAGTDWEDESYSSRAVSSCVVFDDSQPIIVRNGRAISISGGLKRDRHGSISTMTTVTTRRSKGWWNYITTPFLTRSNTMAFPAQKQEDVPEVPILAIAAAKAKESSRERKSWENLFSPLSIKKSNSNASNDWWDVTPLGFRSEKRDSLSGPIWKETRHEAKPSTGTLPFVVSSTASLGTETETSPSISDSKTAIEIVPSHDHGHLTDSTFSGAKSISGHKEISSISEINRTKTFGSNSPFVDHQQKHSEVHNVFVQQEHSDLYNATVVNNVFVQQNHITPGVTRSVGTNDTEPATTNSKPSMIRDNLNNSSIPHSPPPYSPSQKSLKRVRKYKAFFPPGHTSTQTQTIPSNRNAPVSVQYPASPGPISPGMQQAMASPGSVQMSDVPITLRGGQMSEVPLTPAQARTNQETAYPGPNRQPTVMDLTQDYLQKLADKAAKKAEKKRQRNEKEDKMAQKVGGILKCFRSRKGPEDRKKRRCYCCIFFILLLLIILIVTLATTLTRKHHTTAPTQWLNLTGFPPIYSGLSTVAAPVNVVEQSGCVLPTTQWSCSLPKELQSSVSPNQPNQPNFVLNIQWDNSSAANATFANVTGDKDLATRNFIGNPVSAGKFIRDLILKVRQTTTFTPSPAAPSYAEEVFLGNTTDDIVSSNKAGEPTPFYISFLSTTNTTLAVSSRIKRDDTSTNDTNPFPNITNIIPAASVNSDGTAAPANLLPLPSQQPIRLYDRGLPTEHYGFYTYYDRSIFLKSLNTTTQIPDDQNGGSPASGANFRCTWSETRFLVQMWTRMNTTATLNNGTSGTGDFSKEAPGFDLVQPGSFPYPITITTDRHGGDPGKKMIYCYSLNESEEPVSGSGKINEEDRGFGGTVINAAPSVFVGDSTSSLGGFDGGTGGCSCEWENFVKVG